MALNIKDPETDRLARELASPTGQPVTTAVREAIVDKLESTRARAASSPRRRELLDQVAARGRARPMLNDLTEDEILGDDEHGPPS